uniref:Mis18 domain-containing protein n=1 Tax=Gasterosteus aculeatus aculeatus TaxID=481459 RepID=A0AAQ4RG61_GASAC|nr:protein Mis18-beta [Gasterosteus aculeatus aculeatus]
MEFDDSVMIPRAHAEKGAEHKQRMTLHCQQCSAVWGDSFSICGEVRSMDSIVCLRVTNDVVISDVLESGHGGELAGCIYSALKCRGCCCAVGKVIHSAPWRLASVRSMFLLHKANTSCYMLNHSSMVTASSLTFDLKPLGESMNKLRQQFEAQLDEMSRLHSRLADSSVTGEFVK